MKRIIAGLVATSIVLIACGDNRSKLTPHEALIGHWVAELDAEEHFFSKDKMWLVENGEKRGPVEYRVILNSYPHGLVIETIAPAESLTEQQKQMAKDLSSQLVLAFENDKLSVFVESKFGVRGSEIPLGRKLWRYKDARQQPE